MKYAYQMHRSNAKRRKPDHFRNGIPFELSFEEFEALWMAHPEKWEEKKRSMLGESRFKCQWEIDRIDPYQGYHKDNVRIVSKIVNIHYWYNPRIGQMELDLSVIRDADDEAWKEGVPF